MPYERAAGGYMAARKASKKVINFFVVGLTYGWKRTCIRMRNLPWPGHVMPSEYDFYALSRYRMGCFRRSHDSISRYSR